VTVNVQRNGSLLTSLGLDVGAVAGHCVIVRPSFGRGLLSGGTVLASKFALRRIYTVREFIQWCRGLSRRGNQRRSNLGVSRWLEDDKGKPKVFEVIGKVLVLVWGESSRIAPSGTNQHARLPRIETPLPRVTTPHLPP